MLDGIDTAHNRFGEFSGELRLDSDKVVVRKMQNSSDTVLQSDFSALVSNDRPDISCGYFNKTSIKLSETSRVKR